MPKLFGVKTEDLNKAIAQGFHYTSVSVDRLSGASEYTIVGIVVDKTGSVQSFKSDLEAMLAASIDACQSSPRALNLIVRTTAFNNTFGNSNIEEIHGFVPLNTIDTTQFAGTISPDGMTNLYEATDEMVSALYGFGKELYNKKYLSNAIVFIITDGDDNASASTSTPEAIKKTLDRIKKEEVLESIRTILIGINDTDPDLKLKLEHFKDRAKLDEYVSVGEVTKGKLAKLAQFVSQSTSTQSQALGSKGPSQPINFKF